jgi:hypothetical protein
MRSVAYIVPPDEAVSLHCLLGLFRQAEHDAYAQEVVKDGRQTNRN